MEITTIKYSLSPVYNMTMKKNGAIGVVYGLAFVGALALLALVFPQKTIFFYVAFGIAVAQLCFVGVFLARRPKRIAANTMEA